MAKLYASIGGVEGIPDWSQAAKSIEDYSAASKEKFVRGIEKQVGPHGFMIFQEFNHGAWIPLFGVGDGLKSKRVVLGNPLIAITMLKRDLTAGLAVPVELLVSEKKEGGVDLVYQLPSALIAGLNRDEGLVTAVAELDKKLEILVKDVAS
ncbi:hypothetical protein D0Z07_7948 [Hyphodiscus hymeniophilus]|uniref:DUF302 domain-containing protein n=1 Tax=Hyphodiscus hymeniophilus TaxID=353542 RepID=A0A9P6SN69_9HELO|nr:hypothetical protein D0Z07_7948 [Hyphodiscus hymeniophilus]